MMVLKDTISKSMRAYLRATEILDGNGQYAQVWREYVLGYVAMHLGSSRYLLSDIGLDGKYFNN